MAPNNAHVVLCLTLRSKILTTDSRIYSGADFRYHYWHGNVDKNKAKGWVMPDSHVPLEISGLDHLVLRVRSLEKALHFYRDILGCAVERELPELGLTQLRAGTALIDIVPVDSELGRMGGDGPQAAHKDGGRNVDHFALKLAAFDAELLTAHLASHGVVVGEIAQRYGADGFGPSIYIEDPDGNIVELKG